MDPALKQRLVGAGVLVALAVIFLPMLVQGPAPDSGVADVPLTVPNAPEGGFESRDLPLVAPGATPEGGALGAPSPQAQPLPQAAVVEEPVAEAPTSTPATAPALATETPVAQPPPPAAAPPKPAATGKSYPAAVASGDYVVSFGSFSTLAAANAAVASLHAAQLPGFRESVQVDGKAMHRVRIGPFASRADAEAARQRALQAGGSSDIRVLALDADAAAAKPTASTSSTAKLGPAPPARAAADVGFVVQVAAFSQAADANALRDRARAAGFSAFADTVPTDKGNLVRVRIGPVASRADAERLQAQVQAKLGIAGLVRPHP